MAGFNGTVTLVALCFVAVLGITLAGYITVCSRAMQLSNRSFQSGLGQQLAELGLVEGLRAFNKNDWSDWSSIPTNMTTSGAWTLDTTYHRASRTITFQNGKLGQGITATVKIRIDNYDTTQLDSNYSSTATYRLNDLVGDSGVWYRSIQNNNIGNTPTSTGNLASWVPAPISWTWSSDITYSQYDLVNYNGVWYRCITSTSTGNTPTLPLPATTYWVPIPTMRAWATATAYALSDVVSSGGGLYRCISAHTSSAAFATDSANWNSNVQSLSLSWISGTIYTRGAMVYYSGTWYYCTHSCTSSTSPNTDTTNWAPTLDSSGAQVAIGSSTYTIGVDRFFTGDYIYRASTGWYRCIVTTFPYTYASGDYSNTAKWVSTNAKPYISWAYQSGLTYNFNSVVHFSTSGSGTWYRCKVASATSVPTTTADWENALSGTNTTSTPGARGWSSSNINYNLGDVVYYYSSSTSQWHRCIKAHTSSATFDSSKWSDAPLLPTAWDPNHQYSQYDTVRYQGVWYLSLRPSNYANDPVAASSSYWAVAPRSLAAWDSTKIYGLNDMVSASGVWYRCITPHTNQAPPNATYWTVLTGSGSSYVWNSTTNYSVANYRSYGDVWYRCDNAPPSYESPNSLYPSDSPATLYYWTALGAPVIYAEAAVTIANNPSIKTQLRATIAPAPLFPNAAAATTTLTISSGTGTVDSYDSSVASMATGGTYTTNTYGGANIGYSAVLAASSSASSAITISNSSTVKGYLAQPTPGSGISTNTTVWGPTSPASPKVDTSRVSRSPYIPQFDPLPSPDLATAFTNGNFPKGAVLPSYSSGNSSTTVINLGTRGATGPSRYYISGNFNIGSNNTYDVATLNINGPVILFVNGNLRVNIGGTITINRPGSVEIHFSDRLRIENGSNGIINRTLDPKTVVLIGDNSTDSLSQYYSDQTNVFYGTIYLPNTISTTGLNVTTGVTMYGALSSKLIYYTAEATLHYDTSLRYATIPGVDQPYTITKWRELPATEQATMP